MTLPVPTLDHVVINARDDMDRAAELYQRLGFQLTPRGYHTLGSMNHLAMFGTDYLELIAIPKGATTGRLDLLNYPHGLNGLVFGTEDSATTYAALKANSAAALCNAVLAAVCSAMSTDTVVSRSTANSFPSLRA